MRALVQRVSYAKVEVSGDTVGEIGPGLLVFLGVTETDSETEARYLAQKISKLRIFNDDAGKMNLSVKDIGGGALAVSQFTLYADAKKGNRPSYVHAAPPDHADPLFERFKALLADTGLTVASGVFAADMKVSLLNDGPVTIWLDTAELVA
ncbi:MAG: D-aminoacyl-tRNA deacylase [Trueperaceae bacterium]|nr:D-aminoacyl-tRNA deacylase [Trueperaceae bacterium]